MPSQQLLIFVTYKCRSALLARASAHQLLETLSSSKLRGLGGGLGGGFYDSCGIALQHSPRQHLPDPNSRNLVLIPRLIVWDTDTWDFRGKALENSPRP